MKSVLQPGHKSSRMNDVTMVSALDLGDALVNQSAEHYPPLSSLREGLRHPPDGLRQTEGPLWLFTISGVARRLRL